MSELQRIQTRPMSDGNPGSSSIMSHQYTPRPRLDNILTWPPIQGEHLQSSGSSGANWSPPTLDHDFFLTVQEAEQLLRDSEPSQHPYGSGYGHHVNMPSTSPQYPDQSQEHVASQQIVNAASRPGSSSSSSKAHGGARPGAGRKPGNNVAPFHLGEVYKDPLERPLDTQVSYRDKTVSLWIYPGTETTVEQASFEGMTRPKKMQFYKKRNFLVFLDELDGKYATVVYLEQDETLLAVRAPKKTRADIMEPTENTWFIVFSGRYFRLRIIHGPDGPIPRKIELATNDGRSIAGDDQIIEVVFPFRIVFCAYKGKFDKSVQGAFLPGFKDNKQLRCRERIPINV